MSMAERPEWLQNLSERFDEDPGSWFTTHPVPDSATRFAAVLASFSPGPEGRTRVILTERTAHLRSHAGQVSLPGGRLDPGEEPVQAALREAHEEVGLPPDLVEISAVLPSLWITPSATAVTPVIGWSPEPVQVHVASPQEVQRVALVDLERLLDPGARFTVTGPGGYRGLGFDVDGLFVWGFTAQLLASIFDTAGLTQPWDPERTRRIPWRVLKTLIRPAVNPRSR